MQNNHKTTETQPEKHGDGGSQLQRKQNAPKETQLGQREKTPTKRPKRPQRDTKQPQRNAQLGQRNTK